MEIRDDGPDQVEPLDPFQGHSNNLRVQPTNKPQTTTSKSQALTSKSQANCDQEGEGDITPVPPADAAVDESRAREIVSSVYKRFVREGRWKELEALKDDMMRDAKRSITDKTQRQAWVYSELDRIYPPLNTCIKTDMISEVSATRGASGNLGKGDDGAIQGLGDLPGDWPELPANASLAVEVGWVQANRLRIVEERPGGATRVRLELALSPAPSWSALGWLETSIRSYAKFVDVTAKVSGGTDDEGAVMRRERRSIEEVRALLAEMEEAAETCPSCGRPM